MSDSESEIPLGFPSAHKSEFDRARMGMIFIGTVPFALAFQKTGRDSGKRIAMTVSKEIALDIPGFKGRILLGYDEPGTVEALKDCDALLGGARILEDSRNRVGVVTLAPRDGQTKEFVVKEFRIRGVTRWKSLVLPSKAKKAWQGSLAMVEKGFLTPYPVAYLERRTPLLLERCYFISEYVPDIEEVRGLFRTLPHEELTPLLRDLARHLARCAAGGILHRDLSDGNVLVGKKTAEPFQFFLLDTNRIRSREKIGVFRGIKSLIRLGVPPGLQRFFLEEYLSCSPVKRVHWLWYRLNKSSFTGYVRLKELLRLRKLARRLKIQ